MVRNGQPELWDRYGKGEATAEAYVRDVERSKRDPSLRSEVVTKLAARGLREALNGFSNCDRLVVPVAGPANVPLGFFLLFHFSKAVPKCIRL
jgi:hypothetical protein